MQLRNQQVSRRHARRTHRPDIFRVSRGASHSPAECFTSDEARDEAHVAVIGEGLWRDALRRRAIRDRKDDHASTIDLRGDRCVAVAVQPPSLGAATGRVWLPLKPRPAEGGAHRGGATATRGDRGGGGKAELDSLVARPPLPEKARFNTVIMDHRQSASPFTTLSSRLAASVALVIARACAKRRTLADGPLDESQPRVGDSRGAGAGEAGVSKTVDGERCLLRSRAGVIGRHWGFGSALRRYRSRPPRWSHCHRAVDATNLESAVAVTGDQRCSGCWARAVVAPLDGGTLKGAGAGAGRSRGTPVLSSGDGVVSTLRRRSGDDRDAA